MKKTIKSFVKGFYYMLMFFSFVSLAFAGTVTRSFDHDPTYASDADVAVNLAVDVNAGETFYLIDETYPTGFTVSNNGGGRTDTAGHIKWLVYMGAADTTLTYVLQTPGTTGNFAFNGIFAMQGATTTSSIAGDASLQIGTCTPSTEICDSLDNDCDYLKDEGCDDDKDSYADSSMTCTGTFLDGNGNSKSCATNGNPSKGDCDDMRTDVNPGQTEVCDNIDHNCDGNPYNGFTMETCQVYCTASTFTWTNRGGNLNCCGNNVGEGSPYQTTETSCADGKDNDCNGLTDANDPACVTCVDADGDGYKAISAYCPGSNDCDDTNANVHPGATEICDGKDTDCVGGIPASEANADGDSKMVCEGDCNDNDPLTYPGAEEICTTTDNTDDNDCDGFYDEPVFGQGIGTKRQCYTACTGIAKTQGDMTLWYQNKLNMLDMVQGLTNWYACP